MSDTQPQMMTDLNGNQVPIPQGATFGAPVPATTPAAALSADNMMTDLKGNRVPIPQGATFGSPASGPADAAASVHPEESTLSKVGDVASDVAVGFAKGAGQTVNGVSNLLNKIPVVGKYLAPTEGVTAATQLETPTNTAQKAGVGLETVAEFLAGDELLKAGTISAQLAVKAKYVKLLESSPPLLKAANMAMDAAHMATVQGTQSLVKSGGDVPTAAKEAGTMGVLDLATHGAANLVSPISDRVLKFLAEQGELGKTAEGAAKYAKEQPIQSRQEVNTTLSEALDKSEQAMHSDFDSAYNQVKSKLSGKIEQLQNLPVFDAAKKLQDVNANLPEDIKAGLRSLTPNAGKIDALVNSIADSPEHGVGADFLFELRQDLNKRIASADQSLKPAMESLLDSVDESLDKLSAGAGADYTAARTAYKTTRDALKDNVVERLRSGKIDDAMDYLTSGSNPASKIKAVKVALGDEGGNIVQQLGTNRYAQLAKDALDEAGNFNAKQFAESWRSIPLEARKEMFTANPGLLTNVLNPIVDAVRRIEKTTKIVKGAAALGGTAALGLGLSGLSDTTKTVNSTLEIIGGLASIFGGREIKSNAAEWMVKNASKMAGPISSVGKKVLASPAIPFAAKATEAAVVPPITHYYDAAKNALIDAKDYLMGTQPAQPQAQQ